MFVSKEAVPLTLDDENFIFIKPKLNYGEMNRVKRAAVKASTDTSAAGLSTEVDVVEFQDALLRESIVRWHGPMFEGRACTPENIAELDPDDPLLAHVTTEVSKRNIKKAKDPKALLESGEAPSGAPSEAVSVTGTSTSVSQ